MTCISTENSMRNNISLTINDKMKLEFLSYWNYYAQKKQERKSVVKKQSKKN